MIRVQGIHKSFGEVHAVRGLSFDARDGRITGLLGPNGAGKSTTLRILCTLLKPDQGTAIIDGADVIADSCGVRRRTGSLPHDSGLYPRLTARENIAYYARLCGLDKGLIEDKVDSIIETLEIGDFADRRAKGFSHGQRTVELYLDQANTAGDADVGRVHDALFAYNQTLASIRVSARGVNPNLLRPLNIDTIDVSTPSGRAAILLGMMSYFLLFSLLMGGMYLAIDATAGERERGSLEPLLSLPVTRTHLILGKIAACGVFMAFSLLLSLLSWFVALRFMPLTQIGMTPNFNLPVVLAAFLLLCPMLLVGASLMTLIASFTKTYKEAQTWLSFAILAPTMPILIVSFLNLRPRLEFMFVPSLSQHLILVDMISNEPMNGLHAAISVASTLALGVLLAWACVRVYHRETLLG